MTQFTGKVSKRAGRIIRLGGCRGSNHEARPINIRQASNLAAQLSNEEQGNMTNPLIMSLHTASELLEGIGPLPGSSRRSDYSMGRFLDPYNEAPWTPEARREAHSKSRLTELSILSSNFLTIIGSPDQEPHTADVPTACDNSPDSYTPGIIRASKVQSDALARFLDPRSEAPWTPEDLGRRERIVENLWVANELLCGDDEL